MSARSEFGSEAVIPSRPFDIEAAWRGENLATQPQKWSKRLEEAEIAEIERAVATVRAAGTPLDRISPATFPLPTLGPYLQRMLERPAVQRAVQVLADRRRTSMTDEQRKNLFGDAQYAKR